MEDVISRSAASDIDEDHYSVLSRMVSAASRDHSQLRSLVYEFARRKLRRNLYQQFEDGEWSAVQERMRALEAAIERVETEFVAKTLISTPEPALTLHDSPQNSRRSAQGVVTVENRGRTTLSFTAVKDQTLQPISAGSVFYAVHRNSKLSRSFFWWNMQVVLATLLGVAIYAAVDLPSRLSWLKKPHAVEAAANAAVARTTDAAAKTVARRPVTKPAFLPPTDYGVYALSSGKLSELGELPIRVPDPRVAISPPITAPSKTHLPPGATQFIVFRRDLASSAPDRVTLRVVARVKQALTFDAAGKPAIKPVPDTWVVRSNSYQMRVAPVANNPEMIEIRAEQPDVILPAGRYALVLKGGAYDFTIDGPQTDPTHCLERTDALNSPVYTECRHL